jgi:3-oxoacyl-[acyl-carrier-protein] synthase-3
MQQLGAKCPAFDVNAACSGFVYALDVAKCYINSGSAKNVLIISAEVLSRHIDWTDRNTCILFGDGAGACVVTEGNALKYSKLGANGNVEPLFLKAGTGNNPFAAESIDMGYLQMQGQAVFKFAVKTVGEEAHLAFTTLGITADEVDYFILHQANKRIIDGIRTRLRQPPEKFPMNIDKYGNMSAASIPVLLDEMLCEGKIKPGDKIVMIGFGAGMTTGTCVMTWE